MGLAVLGLAVVGYVLFGPPPGETLLEAGSVSPLTQPLLPETALEPPEILPTHPDPVIPDAPPAEMEPGALAPPREPAGPLSSFLPDQPYVGPPAPEFTGSPAPANLGLVDGVVFGKQVLGLRPELLERLQRVERSLPASMSGVEMMVGYRKGSRSHSQGLAVDLNYFANPYLMHESGESARDAQLGPIYHRIADLMLGRPSVIPEGIIQRPSSPARTLQLYRSLREESRAMIAYFRLMQDRGALERFLLTGNAAAGGVGSASLQRQMMRDYVTLSGRPGPPIPGMEYPAPEAAPGDPPFAGDPTYRGPELGFLNLREDLVSALTDAGLRWGGMDMDANSGDLMHFYLPSPLASRPLGSRRSGENQLGGAQK
jgi:hypothetical protein